MTRLIWSDRMTGMPLLPALTRTTRLPGAGRLTGLTLLDRLTILTSVIRMERLSGQYRQEGLYRLPVMATHTRMTRTITPTSRRMFISG